MPGNSFVCGTFNISVRSKSSWIKNPEPNSRVSIAGKVSSAFAMALGEHGPPKDNLETSFPYDGSRKGRWSKEALVIRNTFMEVRVMDCVQISSTIVADEEEYPDRAAFEDDREFILKKEKLLLLAGMDFDS